MRRTTRWSHAEADLRAPAIIMNELEEVTFDRKSRERVQVS
jgi:hypothetical protein